MEIRMMRNGLNRLKYIMVVEAKCLSKLEIIIRCGISALIIGVPFYFLLYRYQYATEKSFFSAVARTITIAWVIVAHGIILEHYRSKARKRPKEEHHNLSRNRKE